MHIQYLILYFYFSIFLRKKLNHVTIPATIHNLIQFNPATRMIFNTIMIFLYIAVTIEVCLWVCSFFFFTAASALIQIRISFLFFSLLL